MLQIYAADTGTLLQSLELAVLGRYKWVVDNQLFIWGLNGRDASASYQDWSQLWLLVLHSARGVVSTTISTSGDEPLDMSLSPGQYRQASPYPVSSVECPSAQSRMSHRHCCGMACP